MNESGGQLGQGGWTPETLLAHLTARIDGMEQHFKELMDAHDQRYEQRFIDSGIAVNAALSAAEKAVTKAEGAAERRFEGVNEFRAQLGDQQRTLMPRSEAELSFKGIEARLKVVEQRDAEQSGRVGRISVGTIVGIAGILIAVITLVMRFAP